MQHHAFCGTGFATVTSTAQAGLPKVSSGRIERLEAFPSQQVAARNVDVWLPDGYPAAAPYAVLYMHDGQMLFDATQTWNKQEWHADEVASGLIRSGKTRPFIIVGVWNNDPYRHSEYFPQKPFDALVRARIRRGCTRKSAATNRCSDSRVESDRYLKFLVTELKPHIDQHYAVDPVARTDRGDGVEHGWLDLDVRAGRIPGGVRRGGLPVDTLGRHLRGR